MIRTDTTLDHRQKAGKVCSRTSTKPVMHRMRNRGISCALVSTAMKTFMLTFAKQKN